MKYRVGQRVKVISQQYQGIPIGSIHQIKEMNGNLYKLSNDYGDLLNFLEKWITSASCIQK